MIAELQYNSKKIKVDLSQPLHLAIPIQASDNAARAWYIGPPEIAPVVFDGKAVSVSEGASVNFNTITFNPHAHGTHTETVGHISASFYSIHNSLKQYFFLAEVITVAPEQQGEDAVISAQQLQFALGHKKRDALIVRSLPNTSEKKTRQYSNTNWPYFTEEAIALLVKKGIKHLLVDLPSVDKEVDNGELKAHHAFWNTKANIRTDATITEFVFVPNAIVDGMYLLNLQIAPFVNDAAPSNPILYKILD